MAIASPVNRFEAGSGSLLSVGVHRGSKPHSKMHKSRDRLTMAAP